MFKEFLIKKMLQSKLKDVPPEAQAKLFSMLEKNPDFFMKVATEVQQKMKTGKSEMEAGIPLRCKFSIRSLFA
jgi:hypothetical protein